MPRKEEIARDINMLLKKAGQGTIDKINSMFSDVLDEIAIKSVDIFGEATEIGIDVVVRGDTVRTLSFENLKLKELLAMKREIKRLMK